MKPATMLLCMVAVSIHEEAINHFKLIFVS